MTIVACLKWVSAPGAPLDERYAGMSAADQSALEFALQHAAATADEVLAVTVGPVGADAVLRSAYACGAHRVVRVDAPLSTSAYDIAAAIAAVAHDATWVWCGDYSLDRGAGSVPAFLAALLDAQQALGAIDVTLNHQSVRAVRRLDGGRREVLEVRAPGVVSVEGATARLRRAGLAAARAARDLTPAVVHATTPLHRMEFVAQPYRPRARALAAPAGATTLDRLRVLTDATATAAARGEVVHGSPEHAAERIVAMLKAWGYLDE